MFAALNKLMRLILCTLIVFGVLFAFSAGAEENYCHDPEAEAQWQALLAKHPKDMELQALHALRIGICMKVDQGMLTLDEGTQIFERARAALIGQWEDEKRQEGLKGKQPL